MHIQSPQLSAQNPLLKLSKVDILAVLQATKRVQLFCGRVWSPELFDKEVKEPPIPQRRTYNLGEGWSRLCGGS